MSDDTTTAEMSRRGEHAHLHRLRQRNRPAYLMCSLFLLLLCPPVVEAFPIMSPIVTGLTTLVLLTSILSVLTHRRQLWLLAVLMVPTLVLAWLSRFQPVGSGIHLASGIMFVVFQLYVILLMLHDVMQASNVTANTLIRAVSVYLMLGIAWAVVYQVVENVDASAFASLEVTDPWGDFVYFSFTTMTTLGYGDISPVSSLARSMVMLQAVIGPLYLTILVARLVAMYRPTGQGE